MKTDEGLDGFRIAMMLIYYQIVYTQGMFDQLYWNQMLETRNYLSKGLIMPALAFIMVVIYSMTSPTNDSGVGPMFYYPFYS